MLKKFSLSFLNSFFFFLYFKLGSAPANCLYFTAYEVSKSQLKKTKYFENKDSLMYFASGIIAETFSCILWLPIDVVKERLQVYIYNKFAQGMFGKLIKPFIFQVQTSLKMYSYKNTGDAIRTILKFEGVRGLYRVTFIKKKYFKNQRNLMKSN